MSDGVLIASEAIAVVLALCFLYERESRGRVGAAAAASGPGLVRRSRWYVSPPDARPGVPALRMNATANQGGGMAIDRETAETYARWFQALSDPTRIVILNYLSRRGVPVAVGVIVEDLGIGQSTVSHHLKTLLAVGFVTRTRQGTARLYGVNHNCISEFPTAADVVMSRSPVTGPGRPPGATSSRETT